MALTPTISRVATNCPAVRQSAETDVLSIEAAGQTAGGNAPVTQGIIDAEIPWAFRTRLMATAQDMAVRYGGGGAYAIARGLSLTNVTLLDLTIGKGDALIDGVVNKPADFLQALDDRVSNYLWLQRDKTIAKVINSLAAPATPAAYLGCIQTDGGQAYALDVSGVITVCGGVLRRETADEGAPEDTPPANVQFLAVTRGGRYWWDGVAYTPMTADTSAISTELDEALYRIEQLERIADLLLLTLGEQFRPEFLRPELLADFCTALEGRRILS
jgi:hypothetical protein